MENRNKMITVTLYMDREDHERLKKAAEKVDWSVSNYCRQLLTAHSRTLIQDKPSQPDAHQATIL